MPEKNLVEFPAKDTWKSVKDARNQQINHVTVTAGKDSRIVDAAVAFDLRIIPRVFTAPLQAIGLVTSIFARMLNTKITLHLNNDKD